MVVTLNGLGKNYSQFWMLVVVWKTFINFQKLITLFISEEIRVFGNSSSEGSITFKHNPLNRFRLIPLWCFNQPSSNGNKSLFLKAMTLSSCNHKKKKISSSTKMLLVWWWKYLYKGFFCNIHTFMSLKCLSLVFVIVVGLFKAISR
jgi:hypothetical protein